MGEKNFTGKRLCKWRGGIGLNASFTNTLELLEEFGFEVWNISSDRVSPSFSYTVGLFDIFGAPELVTVGLAPSTAAHALDAAAHLVQAGVDLSQGRHANLIGKVDVEFRPVDPRWMRQIMLRTSWYYRGDEIPVLQMIYPDLQNRFPDDPEFDQTFAQPDLSAGAGEHETAASDLWLAHDESSSLYRWRFEDSPHAAAYLSETVHDGSEPVTYVSHDADGDWQFLGDKMSDGGGPVVSCLHHPIDRDRSLEELHDLPLGWYAVRERVGEPWERFEHPPSAEEDDTDGSPAEPVN